MRWKVWTAAAATLVLAGPADGSAAQADDDLKVVKKAVATRPTSRRVERIPPPEGPETPGTSVTAQATPAPEPPRPPVTSSRSSAERARPRGVEPAWFKIRIVERGPKPSRVTVNLPLGLVRSLGDEWPVEVRCRECGRVRLSEVLRTLTTGQDIVDIESDDATVRIWVE